MALEPSIAAHDASPAGSRPIRRRSVWAAPVLVIVQLGILAGFAWELEPLLYQPERGQVVSLEYDARWIEGAHRRHSVGTRMLHKVSFPLVNYRYEVNGTAYLGSAISRHPFEEWRAKYTRAVRGRTPGSIITVYVAPWAPDHALLVRAPNFAILFILTIALFFASILSAAARSRR